MITGIGTSTGCLRELCLPLVKEVHIVIPTLQQASELARLNGRDAGQTLLPNPSTVKKWIQREGGKLAAGLLGHLPNVEVIYGIWSSHSYFSNILGEALCQVNEPRSKLRELSHRIDENFPRLRHLRPASAAPMACAMAAGLLPSLARVDSVNLGLNQSSLMKVAQAISEGQLPNLVELCLVPDDSTVIEAFAMAYSHRLQVQGTGGAEQAKLETLEISGIEEEDERVPIT